MKKPDKIEAFNANLKATKEDRKSAALAVVSKEKSKLQFHEDGLKDNADAMFAFAMHLHQIKSHELWRLAGVVSFKRYCEERVPEIIGKQYDHSYLHRLAGWAEVNEDVSEKLLPIGNAKTGESKPETPKITESQARSLAKAPKKKRAKILSDVTKKEKPTAKAIAAAVKQEEAEFEEIATDAAGVDVPKHLVSEFNRSRDETKAMLKNLSVVRSWLKKENVNNAEIPQAAEVAVSDAYELIKTGSADYVCPICKGKKCPVCHKRGFMSEKLYGRSGKK